MVALLNKIIEWAQNLLLSLLDFLPKSPFSYDLEMTQTVQMVMGYVNFFFPVEYCLGVLAAWLSCILIWYIVSWGLRWLQAIE